MSTYGKKINTIQLNELMLHVFETNIRQQESGGRATPVMIWGSHGLGKTQCVIDFAKNLNWKIAYCAPAQFEEMGDLHGMPTIHDPNPEIDGDEITVFRPPSWIPREEGPGILVLDDINRADDRMLRGVMQLLQNFELLSWKLPAKWQIVATANPDDGNYSVTPMDDAMLTRLLHVTLEFDVKAWLKWANKTQIDSRGIDFVSTYPEAITGRRTTPRSLVQFFDQIRHIADLNANVSLVEILASSTLDDETVAAFIGFINEDLTILLQPNDILDSADWKKTGKHIESISTEKNGMQRLDRISTMCMRMYFFITDDKYKAKENHKENLINFLLHESIPNDLKMSFYFDISKEGSESIKQLVSDPRLSKLLLNSM